MRAPLSIIISPDQLPPLYRRLRQGRGAGGEVIPFGTFFANTKKHTHAIIDIVHHI
jgi:hypothetical protein